MSKRFITEMEARILRKLADSDLANLLPSEDLAALLDTRDALVEALDMLCYRSEEWGGGRSTDLASQTNNSRKLLAQVGRDKVER